VDLVVMGIETHVCVQQTVLELLRRHHRVVVLQDCTGGRNEDNHRIALERFRQCGAILTCFESLAFEWTRTKDHAHFKQMSGLVKEG
jgi:nicotinamidase-related amidase